jgi:ATP-dependent helicase/nuclease subunit B
MYHLDQLAALCRAHLTDPKVVFVPSLQAGYNLSTALAAGGESWLNLHLVTPGEWVRKEVVPHLQAAGWKQLLPDYDLLFVEDLLQKSFDKEDGEVAGGLRAVDLVRPVLKTFRDLRNAGMQPEDLERNGLGTTDKAFIIPLFRDYLVLLRKEQLYDEASIYEYALGHPSAGHGGPEPVYALFDEVVLSDLAYQYIEKQTGDRLYRIGRDDYGLPAPQQSVAARFSHVPFPEGGEKRVGSGGRSLAGGLKPQDSADLHLVQVIGAEGEVNGVFREILEKEYPLDTVEVACASDAYIPLLYDFSERFDIPMTFAGGLPPELTRPGQALAGFLRWIASGFDVEELIGLCQAGLITFAKGKGASVSAPRPQEVATLLRKGRIRKGRKSYQVGFKRVERELRTQIAESRNQERTTEYLEQQAERVQAVQAMVDKLFGLVPGGGRVKIQDLTNACIKFLIQNAPVRAGYDSNAIVTLKVHMETIGENVVAHEAPARLAQYLSDLLAQHRVESLGARPGHVYVVPLERAGYSQRQNLYVLGLDEGSFPGRGIEDPILLDNEREALPAGLPLHRRRPGERVWQLVRALGMAPGQVTLMSRRRGLADGSEYYPSAFFQQVADQLGRGLEEEPVVPLLPSIGDVSLTDTETLLAARRCGEFRGAIEPMFPWLVAGRQALEERDQPYLTRFDGWLGRVTAELDPAGGQLPMSASRLEVLVRCPYRYFLQHVLHVEAPEEAEEDTTRWLHPLEFGKLLHALFCDFMEKLQEKGEHPDEALHAGLLQEMLEEEIEAYRERIPVLHEAAFQADRQRLERATQIFLAAESAQTGVEPVGFEVSFGFGHSEGLNAPDPIPLRLNNRIKILLRGFIDRVDQVDTGYHIWDYKTGSAASYSDEALAEAGSYLQWALYAYALNEILSRKKEDGRVVKSGYFFPNDRGNGQRVAPPLPAPAELGARLEPLFALIAQGCFFHLQKHDHCRYCDYRGTCGADPVQKKHVAEIKEAMPEQADITELIGRWING